MPEKIKRDAKREKHDRGDPPNRLDPRRPDFGRKFTSEEIVVVEILVRQIEAVIIGGIFAPARIVIGAAFRTGQCAAGNIFAADWTDVRRFGPRSFAVRHRFHSIAKSSRRKAIW